MSDLDERALQAAMKSLSGGRFEWQAYLVMCAAEGRIGTHETREAEGSGVDESIDSFGARFAEYARTRGTDSGFVNLERCVSVGVATFSELLAETSGEERECVRAACLRIGQLAG